MGRRLCWWLLTMSLCLALSACGGGDRTERLAMEIREAYLAMEGCSAALEVTADYGQRVYQYGLELDYRREGESLLTLTAPEEVAGITARLAAGETALEYDGVRVETGPLDPSGLSPVEAAPALLECAASGFLAECAMEELAGEDALRMLCREPDQPAGTGLEYSLWFDPDTGALLRGEVSQDGFTVVQCVFSDFQMIS